MVFVYVFFYNYMFGNESIVIQLLCREHLVVRHISSAVPSKFQVVSEFQFLVVDDLVYDFYKGALRLSMLALFLVIAYHSEVNAILLAFIDLVNSGFDSSNILFSKNTFDNFKFNFVFLFRLMFFVMAFLNISHYHFLENVGMVI